MAAEVEGIARPTEHARLLQQHNATWLLDSRSDIFGWPRTEGTLGSVWVLPSGDGGAVDEALDGLPAAVDRVLAESNQIRHLEKLSRCEADEKHLFLILGEGAFPISVMLGLFGTPETVPEATPTLPTGLSHLWFVVPWCELLFCVSGDGWDTSTLSLE